jgi:hypothetical protein
MENCIIISAGHGINMVGCPKSTLRRLRMSGKCTPALDVKDGGRRNLSDDDQELLEGHRELYEARLISEVLLADSTLENVLSGVCIGHECVAVLRNVRIMRCSTTAIDVFGTMEMEQVTVVQCKQVGLSVAADALLRLARNCVFEKCSALAMRLLGRVTGPGKYWCSGDDVYLI